MAESSISFQDYLQAKEALDDRSLNRYVWNVFTSYRPGRMPLRVLELGAGMGTMLTRLYRWGFLPGAVEYTAVDAAPANARGARTHLRAWARAHGCCFQEKGDAHYLLECPRADVDVHWHTADVFEFLQHGKAQWDVVIAHAFLDLVDVGSLLPDLFRRAPGGLFYFTLNFDGVTILEPEIDAAFDALVMEEYHRTMDERYSSGRKAGESRTGRRLLQVLPKVGGRILAAGSSDWVVFPRDGGYSASERAFLHFIVETIHSALWDSPQVAGTRFERWIEARHAQIEQGTLIYLAHQVDVTGLIEEE